MIAKMTHTNDDTLQMKESNRHSKPNTLYEIYCKTGINPEDLIKKTPKPNPLQKQLMGILSKA